MAGALAMTFLGCWFGLTIGNFSFQLLWLSFDWAQAAERSFWQGTALFAYWLCLLMTERAQRDAQRISRG